MVSENAMHILKVGVDALKDKKAENVKVIDISEISVISDIMVIAEGNNDNQLHAMADTLEEKLNKENIHHISYEGYEKANWILMDYSDVIFQLFDKESRSFYDLERLYCDGKYINLE